MHPQPSCEQLPRVSRPRSGFTLVEVLTVIVIIAILLGIAVPAVFRAIETAKTTEMRLESGVIADNVQRYQEKYGDYPPDFSSWTVVERHYRKIFPRIAAADLNRLRALTDVNAGNDDDTDATLAALTPTSWPAHDATVLDRAEAIVWSLGGYSSNPLNPFTGPGGPLELISANTTTAPVLYQINIDRDNILHNFDPARIDLVQIPDPSIAVSATNRHQSSDGDLFASYAADDDGAPFVYFDSRTYAFFDATLSDFNGYGSTSYGVIRPYFSNLSNANTSGSDYPSLAAALGAWQFVNPDSFQIIAPGTDANFGSVPSLDFDSSSPGDEPLYFQYPTGLAIAPSKASGVNAPGDLIVPGIRAYQESAKFSSVTEDFQLDNVTSFSKAKIIDDLQE